MAIEKTEASKKLAALQSKLKSQRIEIGARDEDSARDEGSQSVKLEDGQLIPYLLVYIHGGVNLSEKEALEFVDAIDKMGTTTLDLYFYETCEYKNSEFISAFLIGIGRLASLKTLVVDIRNFPAFISESVHGLQADFLARKEKVLPWFTSFMYGLKHSNITTLEIKCDFDDKNNKIIEHSEELLFSSIAESKITNLKISGTIFFLWNLVEKLKSSHVSTLDLTNFPASIDGTYYNGNLHEAWAYSLDNFLSLLMRKNISLFVLLPDSITNIDRDADYTKPLLFNNGARIREKLETYVTVTALQDIVLDYLNYPTKNTKLNS